MNATTPLEKVAARIAELVAKKPSTWYRKRSKTYYDATIEVSPGIGLRPLAYNVYLDKDASAGYKENYVLFVCNDVFEPFLIEPIAWHEDAQTIMSIIKEECNKEIRRYRLRNGLEHDSFWR